MPKIVLSAPAHVLFETIITVQIGDINYGKHLSNDAVLRLVHEARLRWLATGELNEIDIDGVGMIMAHAHIHYQAQAFYGDELLFALGITEVRRTGFTLHTQITRLSDGITIAKVETGMAFFDYAQQKVARMPARFRQFIEMR